MSHTTRLAGCGRIDPPSNPRTLPTRAIHRFARRYGVVRGARPRVVVVIVAFERELAHAQWRRSAADLAAAGVSRDMTRGSAWRRTTRGYFVPSTIPDSTAQRILDVAPLIPPSGALAGWVAAYISGADVLDGLDPFTMARQPLPVHLGRDLGRAGLPQVRYVRERLPETDRQIRHGLPVTTPLRTAFDGARWAPNLVEAVVFLDQVAHAQRLDLAELNGWCTPGARWPG
jgi:hypothetical protein